MPHDPDWHIQAEILITDLKTLFGPFAERIDHVGSTAIPGIAAKPKLHLDILLRRGISIEEGRGRLDGLGYFDHGPRLWDDEIQLTRPVGSPLGPCGANGVPTVMPHRLCLCLAGCAAPLDRRRFRDALLRDRTLAQSYEQLKLQLASQNAPAENWQEYTAGKSTFIAAVLANEGQT
ncbi:GrpB family protein [Roseibium sp. M-1]